MIKIMQKSKNMQMLKVISPDYDYYLDTFVSET
jgi:hypothetical protein